MSSSTPAVSIIIVLLNNDTRGEPDWLNRLVAGMDHYPEASFAAGKNLPPFLLMISSEPTG